MGTIHHHIAVATTYSDDYRVQEAFYHVVEFAKSQSKVPLFEDFDKLLIGPVHGVMNSYRSYLMVPDGSKEWWNTSDDADVIRNYFVEEMSKAPGCEVFVGSWGEMDTTADFVNGDNENQLA